MGSIRSNDPHKAYTPATSAPASPPGSTPAAPASSPSHAAPPQHAPTAQDCDHTGKVNSADFDPVMPKPTHIEGLDAGVLEATMSEPAAEKKLSTRLSDGNKDDLTQVRNWMTDEVYASVLKKTGDPEKAGKAAEAFKNKLNDKTEVPDPDHPGQKITRGALNDRLIQQAVSTYQDSVAAIKADPSLSAEQKAAKCAKALDTLVNFVHEDAVKTANDDPAC